MKINFQNIVFATLICAVGCTLPAIAQVDKSVEVTREFNPTIGAVTKLSHTPDMSDDVFIKPDIDYSITPIAHHNRIESKAYNIAKVNFYRYNSQDRFYFKGGFGTPLMATGDMYATFGNTSEGYFTGFANYDGQYGNIKNDFGDKLSAKQNLVRTGIVASRYFDARTLDASVVYTYSDWSRYATNSAPNDYRSKYNDMNVDFSYGDVFSDFNRWNYRIDGRYDAFWSGGSDRTLVNTFEVGAAVGRKVFSTIDLTLSGGFDYRHSDTFRNSTPYVGLDASYIGRKWRLNVGFDTMFDKTDETANNTYFIPKANFDFNLFHTQVVVYTVVGGYLQHHDFASLVSINPYVKDGYFKMQNSAERNYGAGVKGSILSERINYDLGINYRTFSNNLFWAFNIYDDGNGGEDSGYVNNYYTANVSDMQLLNLGLDFKYMPSPKIDIWTQVDFNKYIKSIDEPYAIGKSAFEMKVGAAYNAHKIRFGANMELYSRRKFTQIDLNAIIAQTEFEVPAVVDLGAFIDYNIHHNFSLWCNVDNILGSSLYEWGRYKGYGLNAMAGVKIQF